MSTYEPGTVAIATVRGVPNVRVMRVDDDTFPWTAADGHRQYDREVTNIRPLVVFQWDGLEGIVKRLRDNHATTAADIADQLEAQILKPPRIPEPGLWGVVEAGHKHLDNGRRSQFVRVSVTGRFQWVEREAEADWGVWDDLIDPTLVRDGIEATS